MEIVLQKGSSEKVPQEQVQRNESQVWYIPHHGVNHKRKKKLRVVFDCSSTYKVTFLNSELLLGVLLRFRQEKIAVMADIEAMYYQVQVQKDHQDFLRWWPEGDISKPLEVYRMKVHMRCISSAQYLYPVLLTLP